MEQEIVTAVNRSGVDINDTLNHRSAAAMLPFVAGFGPRKAQELIKQVKVDGRGSIMSRAHLMEYGEHVGETVLWTGSGFLYCNTDDPERNDLDRTRVHPESYRYATKIAKDASGELPTQVEVEVDDIGRKAVKSILEDPGNRLDNIDLRVFARELEKQGQVSAAGLLRSRTAHDAHAHTHTHTHTHARTHTHTH
jgi:transcription elongation factor SPT6